MFMNKFPPNYTFDHGTVSLVVYDSRSPDLTAEGQQSGYNLYYRPSVYSCSELCIGPNVHFRATQARNYRLRIMLRIHTRYILTAV